MFFGKATIPVNTDGQKIEELLSRAVSEILPSKDSLETLLLSGKRLRIKLGFDPTGEKLHAGHSAPLLKLRDFQELGHTIVFIVGDFTAVIGDTSDKESERPMLPRSEIEKNMRAWKSQVAKILDLGRAEFRYNSEWLSNLTYREIGEHADLFSVSDFIARENISRRLQDGKRVSLRELLYPLMQGYDSIATRADVEIGGTDQRFNLLAGRVLQEKAKQAPQHVMTLALLTDSTGKKLSKTGGATVYLTDAPQDMFGKVMAIPDELMQQYFISMTRMPMEKVREILLQHPKDAKQELAKEIVKMYHGDRAAEIALQSFHAAFSDRSSFDDALVIKYQDSLMKSLVVGGVVESNSEFRRLLEAGALRYADTDEVIRDESSILNRIIRIGKKRFVKIVEK